MAIRGDLTHHAPPWWTKVQQNKMLTESKEKERDREREGGWLLAIYRGYHWPPSHTHAHASSHKVRQYQADKRGINKRRQPPKEKKGWSGDYMLGNSNNNIEIVATILSVFYIGFSFTYCKCIQEQTIQVEKWIVTIWR